ncbi:MAG: hypothetical protein IJK74_06045 [Bacteroidales bacterium]|nr:hypothetical protein [Bacteroidales bacterium]
MSENIQLRIEVEDNGSIKKIRVNYDDLEKAIKRVKKTTDKLNDSMVNLASTTQALQNISSLIGKLADSFSDLTSAYEIQQAAETRLSQVMRNTMGASEAEIESIKALCAEQQKLGVIGDEVQLAAAQELATYLEMPSNLKTLIPLMNDMAVQQYGVSASAESVTQIAAMMGKVMQGQTEALGRNGYRFSEVQKQILKYGNETERVAVLVDVCGSVVDGMNEKLGELPIGRLAQLRNAWGDIKETIGSITVRLQKYISVLGRLGMSASGLFQIPAAFKAAEKSLSGWLKKSPIAALSFKILDIRGRIASRGIDATRKSVNRLNIAFTSGIIGLVVTLGTVLFSLFSSSKKAKEGLEEVDEATQAYKDTASEARGAIEREIIALKNIKGQQTEEIKKVDDLNKKYGEAFGVHKTAAEWYDTLINKSEAYCRQLAYEAQAKALQDKYGKELVEVDEAQEEVDAYIKANGGNEPEKTKLVHRNVPVSGRNVGSFNQLDKYEVTVDTDFGRALKKRDSKQKQADNTKAELEKVVKKAEESGKQVNDGKTPPESPTTPNNEDPYNGKQLIQSPINEKGLQNNVKYFENRLSEADASDTESYQQLIEGYGLAQQALEDYKNAKDKALLDYKTPDDIKHLKDIAEAAEKMKSSFKGNVDLLSRPFVEAATLAEKGWEEAGEGIATVFSAGYGIKDESGKEVEILVTPILPNGDVLSPEELDDYVKQLSGKDILSADTKGIVISIDVDKNAGEELHKLQEVYYGFGEVNQGIKNPLEGDAIEKINKAIEYQQKLREKSSEEEQKGIDGTIKALNVLKTAYEDSLHANLDLKDINTYQQLEDELSYYSKKLQTTSESERVEIQKKINELNKLKKKWDEILDSLNEPTDISALNSIEEIDTAISFYQTKLNKATKEQYAGILKIISALKQAKAVRESKIDTHNNIVEMQVETGQLSGLEGKSLKMKLELIGLDGVAQKIRDLQEMLNDPSLTEEERQSIKRLISQYQGYLKVLLKTDKGMIQTWGTVKGLGSSIEGMTEAIKGQGNAWKKISGIIDSTISLYQSIRQIIEIVRMLTGVTKLQEGAEKAKGQASLKSGIDALVGSEQQVSASINNTTANATETASAEGKALANAVSSSSGIPFPYNLIAIGVSVAAVIAALMTSLPKLALGGLATGPTLALVGEYPGASTNPEVIMPANKLKGLLRDDLGLGGKVTFRIEGRNLVGVLAKESHYRSRR